MEGSRRRQQFIQEECERMLRTLRGQFEATVDYVLCRDVRNIICLSYVVYVFTDIFGRCMALVRLVFLKEGFCDINRSFNFRSIGVFIFDDIYPLLLC